MFNFGRNQLSQEEAYKQLKNDKSIILIDVRTVEEFEEDGHVEGSINVPLHTVPNDFAKVVPNKDAKIFIICYSGARAADATAYVKRLGYTDVHNIGGVGTWRYGLV
ncbi:MAG TPA: rhodanese-like domain-containing protein [Erysipelotrichaceae bacterium]|nr:rhodanese-like domain-containing protein [Erysipelotrichaceae bacterium]